MKAIYFILATVVAGLLLAHAVSTEQHLQSIFCALLVILVYLSKDDINSGYLIFVFLSVFAVGKLLIYPIKFYIFPNYSGFVQNVFMFGVSFLLDLILIFLVKNRMFFSLKLTDGKKPSVLEKNYTEGPLYGLLLGYVAIDSIAFLENIFRNLEHFGVNEEFAKQFWEVTFFYDYYEYFKVTLMLLSVAVLYMGVVIRKRHNQTTKLS